jgi:pre-mRNA-splicing factor 38B
VSYTDPWVVGANGVPSSFFCCLYKLILMRLTEKQVYMMVRPDMLYQNGEFIQARNNPYVRAAGFIYIRLLSPPEQLWERLYLFLMEMKEGTEFAHSAESVNNPVL